jgi:hypothetical protein
VGNLLNSGGLIKHVNVLSEIQISHCEEKEATNTKRRRKLASVL